MVCQTGPDSPRRPQPGDGGGVSRPPWEAHAGRRLHGENPLYVDWLHDAMIGFTTADFQAKMNATENSPGSKYWPTGKTILGINDLNPRWCAEYLAWRAVALEVDHILSQELLLHLAHTCPTEIRKMVAFDTQLPMSMPWPRANLTESITKSALSLRVTESGDRLRQWIMSGTYKPANKESAEYDYTKSCYGLEWKSDRRGRTAQAIWHWPTCSRAELPSHIIITEEFTWVDPHLDRFAKLVKDPVEHYAYKLFPENAFFKTNMYDDADGERTHFNTIV